MKHGKVENLYYYPIKGLSAQALKAVDLVPGQGFPLDRAFGFARPGSGFDPRNPKPLPKSQFVVLARDAGLARLGTRYDPSSGTLTIVKAGRTMVYDLGTEEGRVAATAFLSVHLGFAAEMRPTLYSANPHKFTDVSVVSPEMMNAVSLINLDSVAHFAKRVETNISAARFRGNILFSGFPPFAELGWVNRHIIIGEARLKVVMRTKRCAATEVNLATGERDIKVPTLLRDHFGHSDMGIYAEVLVAGKIMPGDAMGIL